MTVEQRNWEAARMRVGEVLDAYDKANEEMATLDARRADTKQAIVNLERDLGLGKAAMEKEIANRKAALEQEITEKQKVVADLNEEIRAANIDKDFATKAAEAAVARQKVEEEDLVRVQARIGEARELLAKLRTVGG